MVAQASEPEPVAREAARAVSVRAEGPAMVRALRVGQVTAQAPLAVSLRRHHHHHMP